MQPRKPKRKKNPPVKQRADDRFESPLSSKLDIQEQLNQLEEIIYDSLHLPLTQWTVIDEQEISEQLDLIRTNLPDALMEAQNLLKQRETILLEAEDYAEEIMAAAERRAAKLLDETGIVQRAEQEAQNVKNQVEQECFERQQRALQEMETMRLAAQEELTEMRRLADSERHSIQREADQYADQVLGDLEGRLKKMLGVVQNGRRQLGETSQNRPLERK